MKKKKRYKEIKIMNYEYELIQYALQQLKKSITDKSVIDVLDELILKLNDVDIVYNIIKSSEFDI